MSTIEQQRPQADGGSGAGGSRLAGDGDPVLAQAEPRRPRDFGIDVARLRRLRRIVFAILALPLLLLGLLAVKFVSLPVTQAWHDAAYDRGQYAEASDRLDPVEVLNWFEPYLIHLTRGTDLLQQGQNAAAEKELRRSLADWNGASDLNHPAHAQCKILNNLAISIERQADALKDPKARGDRLFEAEQLLAPCAGGGGGGQGEGQGQSGNGNEDKKTTGGNGKRIDDKRKQADKEAGKDPDARKPRGQQKPAEPTQNPSNKPKHADPSGSKPPEEAPTQGDSKDRDKQDKLRDRNEKANQGDGEESSGGSSQNPDRPW